MWLGDGKGSFTPTTPTWTDLSAKSLKIGKVTDK
jgi:hypothetical protein